MLLRGTPKMREAVASLSTGNQNPLFAGGRAPHYDRFSEWWDHVVVALQSWGMEPIHGWEPPHSEEGHGVLRFCQVGCDPSREGHVWFTWYRMPTTRRWEIICYVC